MKIQSILMTTGLVLAAQTALAGKPAPTPSPAAVALVVTVDATDSLGNPCGICGDAGEGEPAIYENGQDGVTASFDTWGNLIIAFNAQSSPIVRKLVYKYEGNQQSGVPFVPPAAQNSYLATGTHPLGPIQTMAEGQSQCVNSNITFTDNDANGTMYRNHYRRALGSHDVSGTSWLVVTRIDADTWELEPRVDVCNPTNAGITKLFSWTTRGKTVTKDLGTWLLPFKMTLQRQ
jgi:hypothetical protein